MAAQVQKKRTPDKPTKTEDAMPHADHKSADELKSEIDAILDDIEDVLEENAADFVSQYVQQGGQ